MATQEFGGRMADDVRTPGDGLAEIGRGQGVVDDEGNARLMGDRRHCLQIDDDAAGIGEVLQEDRLAARRQRAAEILRICRIDKMAGPAELLEGEAELGERAAIEIARGDELVARLHQSEEGEELPRMAGGC